MARNAASERVVAVRSGLAVQQQQILEAQAMGTVQLEREKIVAEAAARVQQQMCEYQEIEAQLQSRLQETIDRAAQHEMMFRQAMKEMENRFALVMSQTQQAQPAINAGDNVNSRRQPEGLADARAENPGPNEVGGGGDPPS